MSKALPFTKRQEIVQSWQSGNTFSSISKEHKVAYHTVRTLCKRFDKEGEKGILPRYFNCGPKSMKSDSFVFRCALWLKRLHRNWGAPLIRLKLEQRYPLRKIPTERTIQLWFRAYGLNVPRSKHTKAPKEWAAMPHDVWQIDGKEEQVLKDGTVVSWLTIVDEKSCALLGAPAFSKKEFTAFPFVKYN